MHGPTQALRSIILALAAALACICLQAQNKIELTDSLIRVSILPAASVYLDVSGIETLAQVQSKNGFVPINSEKIQLGFTSAALWLKFTLRNQTTTTTNWLLELSNKELDSIWFYTPNQQGVYRAQLLGDFVQQSVSEQKYSYPTFQLNGTPGTTDTYYLRVLSASSIHFQSTVWREYSYLRFAGMVGKMLWLFIGFMLIRLLYVIVLTRFIREQLFTAYAVAVFSITVGVVLYSVDITSVFMSVRLFNSALTCIYFAIPVSLLYWAYTLLRAIYPFNWFRNLFIFFWAVGMAGLVLSFAITGNSMFVFISNVYLEIVLVLILCLGAATRFTKLKPDTTYLVLGMFLVFNQMPYSLINLNLLPHSEIMLALVTSLFILEVISMSLLLGSFIKKAYEARVRAVENLFNERNRISADLHDELGSVLTQISLQSDMAGSGIYTETEKQAELKDISRHSRQAIRTMSDIVWSIKSGNDTLGSLLDRMKDHADLMLLPLGTDIRFSVEGIDHSREIDGHLRQEIFLIYKEAIHNINKHSRASYTEIEVHNHAQFTLKVLNDVRNENTKPAKAGNGLTNMKRRAKVINAQLEITKTGNSFMVVMVCDAL